MIPDIEINCIVFSILDNQEVIENRGCGQREKGVASTEVCKGPVGITKTLALFMMIFIVRDIVRCFIHFACLTLPETDGYSPQYLS